GITAPTYIREERIPIRLAELIQGGQCGFGTALARRNHHAPVRRGKNALVHRTETGIHFAAKKRNVVGMLKLGFESSWRAKKNSAACPFSPADFAILNRTMKSWLDERE